MYRLEDHGRKTRYIDEVENVRAELDSRNAAGLILPSLPSAKAPDISGAFASPCSGKRLRDIARGRKKAVILVSDATRKVPTADVLPAVMEELLAAGMDERDVTAVVALGVHRRATESEMRDILGSWWDRILIENHDAFSAERLVEIGTTSCGTPLSVNRTAYEADLRITVGKVEPHEFAGFSGGRKSVLPGIAGERTIRENHNPQWLMDPGAVPGRLEDNPIHEDMLEAAGMLGVDFAVNLLVDESNRLREVFCGDPVKSHEAAVAASVMDLCVKLVEPPQIVVTTPGEPLNICLYQAVKPLIALAPVLAPGGTMILYAKCPEGIDSPDMVRPFEEAEGLDGAFDYLVENYRIQMDHALLLVKIMKGGAEIVVVAPTVPGETIEKMHMTPAGTLQEAVDYALSRTRRETGVLFFPCAQRFLPEIGR